MKKIALLHWTVSPLNLKSMGGLEVIEYSLFHKLQKKYQTYLYAPKIIGAEKNIHSLSHIPWLKKYDLLYYIQFAFKNTDCSYWFGFNTPLLAALFPQRSIIFFQNFISVGNKQVFLPLYQLLSSRYHKSIMIFCSDYLRNCFFNLYPEFPQQNAITIFNAVDENYVSDRTGGYNKPKKIVFVGQQNHLKGFDIFMDAIAALRQERSDFQVFLIGGKKLWQSDIHAVNINSELDQNYITDLGILSHHDTLKEISKMDILVVPSRWNEPFGNVAVEGLAAGLTVISSGKGGLQNSIQNNQTGFVLPDLSSISLKSTLNVVLDLNIKEIEGIRARGYQAVLKKFTWKQYLKKLEATLENVRPI